MDVATNVRLCHQTGVEVLGSELKDDEEHLLDVIRTCLIDTVCNHL